MIRCSNSVSKIVEFLHAFYYDTRKKLSVLGTIAFENDILEKIILKDI